jgi:hypothetical protein
VFGVGCCCAGKDGFASDQDGVVPKRMELGWKGRFWAIFGWGAGKDGFLPDKVVQNYAGKDGYGPDKDVIMLERMVLFLTRWYIIMLKRIVSA